MTLLNIENTYRARFADARIATARGRKGKGAYTRAQTYRAFNYELRIFDENRQPLGAVFGGFPVTGVATHNSPIIKFFKSLGIFRDPETFDPKELVGLEVWVTLNNVCDSQIGLRSVVDQFFP